MITTDQQLLCEKLYKQGKLTIKQIMAETGIRSEQTIYRILDAANIPRRPNRATVLKKTISFDRETAKILEKHAEGNMSKWICDLIKKYYKKK